MEALRQQPHLRFPVEHPEDVGAVRRGIAHLAVVSEMDSAMLPQVELVVTELATNLVRHAEPGGWILARTFAAGGSTGVEVVSVDRGPGIADLVAAFGADGDSGGIVVAGGLGCGLATVRRLATEFDVYTQPGSGTVVMARFLPDGCVRTQQWSGISVALDGGDECGDAWAIADDSGRTTVFVVDGLGHGAGAAEAAHAAVETFSDAGDGDLEQLAARIHAAMRMTRGGAAALCRLDPWRRRADFVGVGNVAGRLVGNGGSHAMVSLNGTLGAELAAPRIRRLSYDLDDGAVLVMSSDGVRDSFDLNDHPGLLDHDPLVVAAVIHRACSRGTDDATVVVARPARVEAAA